MYLPEPSIYNEIYNANLFKDFRQQNMFFVFGSNLAGRHGRGAALSAKQFHGAKYGVGVGFSGNSYAIPTKDENLNILPLNIIENYVKDFIEATQRGDKRFYVSQVGCGLAGYQSWQIAPLFKGAKYCWFPDIWMPYVLG